MRSTVTDPHSPSISQPSFSLWKLRQRCLTLFITGALLVILAPLTGAVAKSGYRMDPGGFELVLPVEKRGDYVISVSAYGRQRVEFTIEGPSSAIEYSTKGRVNGRHIAADFGALGRIDVDLDLVHYGLGVFRQEHCEGRDPMEGEGTYRGTIEFSQEMDVPKVSVHRGRFYLERRFRQVCKRRRAGPKPGPYEELKRKEEEGVLTVRGKVEGRAVRLDAMVFAFRRSPGYSGGTLRATTYERREGVRITRWTRGLFFHNSLVMSKRGKEPETMEVKLPKPFSGRALYSHSPDASSSWTGDLRVDLPGAEDVPLTGSGISAILCRGRVDSCRYGSGSTPNP
jgi:hypothetical protein